MIMNKEIFAILSSLLKQVFILEKTGLKSYVYVRLVENNLNIPFGFQSKYRLSSVPRRCLKVNSSW